MDQALWGLYDGNHTVAAVPSPMETYGTDIAPGTYSTIGGVGNCYWERNNGAGNTIANDFVVSAHNGLTVTVRLGEGFTTEGCGYWLKTG